MSSKFRSGNNCLVVGNNAQALADNCVVVGDDQVAVTEDSVVVGEWLFDEPIPERVQEMIKSYPAEFNWITQIIARRIAKG